MDYAIGDERFADRGIGTRMLWVWMAGARRRYPDVRSYFSSPDHRNGASLRVLEKVGFVRGAWFDEPGRDRFGIHPRGLHARRRRGDRVVAGRACRRLSDMMCT